MMQEIVPRAVEPSATDSAAALSPPRKPLPLVHAPLILSLTGHRDLLPEHLPQLEQKTRQVLASLQARCRHTPLILLTQLASGADQLVARVAAEMRIAIIALLPMPLDLYRADFETPESLRGFESSLALCSSTIEHPIPSPHTRDEAARPGPARDACYSAAGAWSTMHSHLLIALWDGGPAAGIGGTADIVHHMLAGAPLDFRPGHLAIDMPRVGPVVQIVTPRQANPTPAGALAVQWHFPKTYTDHGPAVFHKFLSQIDLLNRDIHVSGKAAENPTKLTEQRQSAVSAAAIRMKRRSATAVALTTIFGLLALAFRALETNQDTMRTRDFGLFAICFGAAVLVYTLARNRRWHSRFLDYRSLAEALRVSTFWRLCGVQSSVHEAYLRRQHDELTWLRSTMSAWTLTDSTLIPDPPADLLSRLKETQHRWVRGQLDFYSHRALLRKSQAARIHAAELILIAIGLLQTAVSLIFGTWARAPMTASYLIRVSTPATRLLCLTWLIFFAASATLAAIAFCTIRSESRKNRGFPGILIAVAILMAGSAFYFAWTSSPPIRGLFLIFSDALAVIAPLIAAALHAYATHHAFAEESRHYARMQIMFHAADAALRRYVDEGNTTAAQSLIESLGRESLSENADWLLTHRERPVTLARP